MEYPQEFSAQAQARVEAERLKAKRHLKQQRKQVPWSRFGPVRADEENLRKYILRVFLVFAQQACELGSQGVWTVHKIREEADEFLRLFTIEAQHDEGHDKNGRKLRDTICQWTGSILPEIQREFKDSAEWRKFENKILALAKTVESKQKNAGERKVTPAMQRRAKVDEYLKEVLAKTGRSITRTQIWKKTGYKSRTEFERWQRDDPNRPNVAAKKAFESLLAEKPHLKA